MTDKYTSLKDQSQKIKKKILLNNPGVKNIEITFLSLEEFKKIYTTDYFTAKEMSYSKKRLDSLAGRYAAKIAVRQVLNKEIPWKDMQILPTSSSEPILESTGLGLEKLNLSLSITHEGDLAAAIAVCTEKKQHVAVGIDATRISRLAEIARSQPRVLEKILTAYEIKELKEPEDAALFWAAKESVSKALGIGIWHGGTLLDIEISALYKEPKIMLKGSLLKKAGSLSLFNWNAAFLKDEKFTVCCVLASS